MKYTQRTILRQLRIVIGIAGLYTVGTSCSLPLCKNDGVKIVSSCNLDSIENFISSVISASQNETNVVYYAGTSNNIFVLVHETDDGRRFWNMQMVNINKDIWQDFSPNPKEWVLMKDTSEEKFRHWDWQKEIVDFIQKIPRNSAIVRPNSSWLQVDDSGNFLWLINDYIVEETLCETLKKGDAICTVQLYDTGRNEEERLLAEVRKSGKKNIRKEFSASKGLCYAHWDNGEFRQIPESQGEAAFFIDDELVAPFTITWNMTYDELFDFNEDIAMRAYKERTEQYPKKQESSR